VPESGLGPLGFFATVGKQKATATRHFMVAAEMIDLVGNTLAV